MIKLSPSVLASDFSRLGEEIVTMEKAGADYIHLDVMDGMFVPSMTIGEPVIRCIRKITDKPFDVHLMIEEPKRYVEEFRKAGADIITIHAEACAQLDRTIAEIKATGARVGVALSPATPLCTLDYELENIDMVLVMTVNPGFGGQKYIGTSTGKIRELRRLIDDRGLDVDIEVDGGISAANVRTVLDAGANVIVSGSALYRGDITENIKEMKKIFGEYDV